MVRKFVDRMVLAIRLLTYLGFGWTGRKVPLKTVVFAVRTARRRNCRSCSMGSGHSGHVLLIDLAVDLGGGGVGKMGELQARVGRAFAPLIKNPPSDRRHGFPRGTMRQLKRELIWSVMEPRQQNETTLGSAEQATKVFSVDLWRRKG